MPRLIKQLYVLGSRYYSIARPFEQYNPCKIYQTSLPQKKIEKYYMFKLTIWGYSTQTQISPRQANDFKIGHP